ncbi:FAD-dependent oxidoreductase [Tomitella biformata]|uniref:FAD-dependent oxidoreductase n=1 Tax=Tomitella biformata TaxID=630403 RepID=UPI00046761D7|nr:FAD-dependent oxidoreductase [Tomitella biformata]
MAYVITQACCNDTACVDVCPVDCIRPTADDAEYGITEQLFIEPTTCIDCGACVDACPVDAIFPEDELSEQNAKYTQINADYFTLHPLVVDYDSHVPPTPIVVAREDAPLRVAVVGTGPAATYAATELVTQGGRSMEVDMFDRLPSPWGLARGGVSPDHQGTRMITDTFEMSVRKPAVAAHLNVEIGKHLSHEELLEHHHAVIYAVGASTDRQLGIPGEDLPGSHPATDFVAWYNGHPDYADHEFDLSGERAVIVGNGNVALDVARMLVMDPDELAKTDIADHALAALRKSNIREVVILGRRGPVQAAYTSKELMGLGDVRDVDVYIDPRDLELDAHSQALADAEDIELPLRLKMEWARDFAARTPNPDRKRIVLKFLGSPVEITGEGRVEGITVARTELVVDEAGNLQAHATGDTETIEAGLVMRSIGYRGVAMAGVPFDDRRGVIPNEGGRVIDPATGEPVLGVYVTGWIKRGPSGFLGTNKKCANDTVGLLAADVKDRLLSRPVKDRAALEALISERQPDSVNFKEWSVLDRAERARGKESGRPRVRFANVQQMVDIAKGRG